MSRGTAVAIAFVVGGGLGAAMVGQWEAFSIGFSFLFWGGLAASVVWIAGGRWDWDGSEPEQIDIKNPDPFIDELGVHHFPGDVFDVENHPTPGAHGRT